MLAVGMVFVGSLALAILLAAFLPGAGLFIGIAVVLLGLLAGAWLLLAGASDSSPSETVAETHEASLLGPGGPDDPR
jgi:hypothetical protein